MGIGTGHGATITFGGVGTYLIRSISGHDETSQSADLSHLGTVAARVYAVPDLFDINPAGAQILFDSELGLPAGGLKATMTITFPTQEGEQNPASISGNGWVSRRKWPDLETDSENLADVDIQFETAPQFNAATSEP